MSLGASIGAPIGAPKIYFCLGSSPISLPGEGFGPDEIYRTIPIDASEAIEGAMLSLMLGFDRGTAIEG